MDSDHGVCSQFDNNPTSSRMFRGTHSWALLKKLHSERHLSAAFSFGFMAALVKFSLPRWGVCVADKWGSRARFAGDCEEWVSSAADLAAGTDARPV